MSANDFLIWEQHTRDSIDVKRAYIDITGDLVAGILLSQIIYWSLPNQNGKSKLRILKEGFHWIAKTRNDWWEECRITGKQFDSAIQKLIALNIVHKKVFKFNGSPCTHLRLDMEVLFQHIKQHHEAQAEKERQAEAERKAKEEEEEISPYPFYNLFSDMAPKETPILPAEAPVIPPRGISITKTTTQITDKDIKSVSLSNYEDKTDKTDEKLNDLSFDEVQRQYSEQLGIEELLLDKPEHKDQVDELLYLVLDMHYSDKIQVGKERKAMPIVRAMLKRLTRWHLEAILTKLQANTATIKNYKLYLQTMIYTEALENEFKMTNRINRDMASYHAPKTD